MLDELKTLKDSITDEQEDFLEDILGPDLSFMFFKALGSKDEDTAEERISEFKDAIKKTPTKAFKLMTKMTKGQKAIVTSMMT